jgi:ribose 5-phosphate isomerase B
MKLALAADHRGFSAKQRIALLLPQCGHEIVDFGCDGSSPATDYPDHAIPAAQAVAHGECDAGILFDGSGIGMSIAANKVPGVRAALAHDEVTARLAREHNHCNMLCLGSDLLSDAEIRQIVEVFLKTPHGDGRHLRRIQKLQEYEQTIMRPRPNARQRPH